MYAYVTTTSFAPSVEKAASMAPCVCSVPAFGGRGDGPRNPDVARNHDAGAILANDDELPAAAGDGHLLPIPRAGAGPSDASRSRRSPRRRKFLCASSQ